MRRLLNWVYLIATEVLLYFVLTGLTCCSTVHKTSQSTSKQTTSIDTSSSSSHYVKETTVTEKSSVPVLTVPDSAQNRAYLAASDTIGYYHSVETDKLSVETSVKPVVRNGKITGYDINSKAVAKQQTIQTPVDKTTTTKETGDEKQQTGKTEVSTEQTVSKTKDAWRPSAGIVIAGVIILILAAIGYVIYKRFIK